MKHKMNLYTPSYQQPVLPNAKIRQVSNGLLTYFRSCIFMYIVSQTILRRIYIYMYIELRNHNMNILF